MRILNQEKIDSENKCDNIFDNDRKKLYWISHIAKQESKMTKILQ